MKSQARLEAWLPGGRTHKSGSGRGNGHGFSRSGSHRLRICELENPPSAEVLRGNVRGEKQRLKESEAAGMFRSRR